VQFDQRVPIETIHDLIKHLQTLPNIAYAEIDSMRHAH